MEGEQIQVASVAFQANSFGVRRLKHCGECERRQLLCAGCNLPMLKHSLLRCPTCISRHSTKADPDHTQHDAPSIPTDQHHAQVPDADSKSPPVAKSLVHPTAIPRWVLDPEATLRSFARNDPSPLCFVCETIIASGNFQSMLLTHGKTCKMFRSLDDFAASINEVCLLCPLLLDALFGERDVSHQPLVQTSCECSIPGCTTEGVLFRFRREDCFVVLEIKDTDGLVGDQARWMQIGRFGLSVPLGSPLAASIAIRTPDLDPNTPRAWAKAKSWLNACLEHDICCDGQAQQTPRRLIDVYSDPPRLVTDLSPRLQYATLSYCWGGDQKAKLTLALLEDYLVALPMEKLSQTLRDAMTICKELGIQYLWIDALCIVQDGASEKAHDLAAMGQTYRNSILTLVAAKGSSADAGMLQSAFPNPGTLCLQSLGYPQGNVPDTSLITAPWMRFQKVSDGLLSTPVWLTPTSHEIESYLKTHAIESRGWTLQERLLSRRLLIYSETNMRWLCRALEACDGGDTKILGRHRLTGALENLRWSGDLVTWRAVVQEYTRREITQPEDKLNAVAALAEDCAAATAYTYAAGLWTQNVAMDLMWFFQINRQQPVPACVYVAPTWSWAAYTDPVGWPPEKFLAAFRQDSSFGMIEYLQTLMYEEVRFGAITAASLRVRGRILCLGSRAQALQKNRDVGTTPPFRLLIDDEYKDEGQVLHALSLGTFDGRSVVGLVMSEQEQGGGDRFRRAGVFLSGFLSQSDFADLSSREIELV